MPLRNRGVGPIGGLPHPDYRAHVTHFRRPLAPAMVPKCWDCRASGAGLSWERRLQGGTRGGDEMNVLYIMGIASVVLFILGFLGLE